MQTISANLNVVAQVDGKEVFHSGVVHLKEQTEVNVKISDLLFVFQFLKDSGTTRYEPVASENTLTIKLFNHENPIGEGLLTPLKVASLNGQDLFLTYHLATLSAAENARRFEFVFYLGGAE